MFDDDIEIDTVLKKASMCLKLLIYFQAVTVIFV